MPYSNIDYQRRCAVSKAWSKERSEVLRSRGSRDWTKEEQREIIETGKCHGYEGQHMFSVKSYPEHAGNEKNIQFLTRKEHLQAHRCNWRNKTDGRYNLRTKRVESFKDGIPKTSCRKLSKPLSDREKYEACLNDQKYKPKTSKQYSKSSDSSQVRKRLPVLKTNASREVKHNTRSKEVFCNKVNKSGNNSHGNTISASKGVGITKAKGNNVGA